MKPVNIAPELDAAVGKVAHKHGLSVSRDTHYDAFNIELQWWSGNQKHRIDFQPYPEGHVIVTKLVDEYAVFGRFLCWAQNVIPFFPFLAKTRSVSLGILNPPFDVDSLESQVTDYLARALYSSATAAVHL